VNKRRICIDLDGVIAQFKKEGQTYADVAPIEGAVERLNQFKADGHYIIINTARHMKTCESNLGLVNARISKITLDWLESHQVPYDEIYFAKPWADIYIDDNAFRFTDWDAVSPDANELPSSSEQSLAK